MAKERGREHTTLTETAQQVVTILKKFDNIKMIAPGIIKTSARGAGERYITAVYTAAGMELIISGQSVQKVAVHTPDPEAVFSVLQKDKRLRNFSFKERERKPGV
ncbi:MAG: DUF2103 domain-containing protein [Candidatus Paceibacterota bacterium]